MSKQLEVLANPILTETLTLLGDEDVHEGLKRLKEIGRFGFQNVDKKQVTDPPNQSASAASEVHPTESHTTDPTSPEPLVAIKIECERQGEYMSEEAFDNLSSPKKGKKRVPDSVTPKTTPTAKRVKLLNPPDDYMLMAEMKRKAIRDCNAASKVSRPTNDPHKVIYNSVKKHNRGLVYGPSQPHSFFKIIGKLFPELEALTDEERVPQLMKILSQFVCRNIDWAEVNFFTNLQLPVFDAKIYKN